MNNRFYPSTAHYTFKMALKGNALYRSQNSSVLKSLLLKNNPHLLSACSATNTHHSHIKKYNLQKSVFKSQNPKIYVLISIVFNYTMANLCIVIEEVQR